MTKISNNINETREIISKWKSQNFSIGFVPTMGYLHDGHLSLIKKSHMENNKTVVSIFVNPTQFGPKEDLSTYPRDFDADRQKCEDALVDLIFFPTAEEMYPSDYYTYVNVNYLTTNLCGKSRPNHFQGVCTVLAKLFNIIKPNKAYFGQKDAQQLSVVKKMVRDLNFDLEIVGCPIIREPDGIAISSRNSYLNKEERKAATCLSQSLKLAKELINNGECKISFIKNSMSNLISNQPLAKIDYIEFVDLNNLQPIDTIKKSSLCAIAVYIGNTRLIDNFIIWIKYPKVQ